MDEVETLKKEKENWKDEATYWRRAWFDQQKATGNTAWVEYYRGVRDGLSNNIYAPGYGKQFYGL